MPVINGKNDAEDEDMGHESQDSDKSDADEMETDSGMDEEHSEDLSGIVALSLNIFYLFFMFMYISYN